MREFRFQDLVNGNIGKILAVNIGDDFEFDLKLSDGWQVSKLRILNGVAGLINVDFVSSEKITVPAQKIIMIECKKG